MARSWADRSVPGRAIVSGRLVDDAKPFLLQKNAGLFEVRIGTVLPTVGRRLHTMRVIQQISKTYRKKSILNTKLQISILITRANVFFIPPLLDQSSEYRKCGFCVRGVECVWNQMETKRSDEISLGDNNTRRKCFQVCATCTRTVMLLGRGGVVSSPHLHVCPTICN